MLNRDENDGALADSLCRQLEDFELSAPAARVLVALLQAGTARASELARVAGVNRTSTYQVLEVLRAKRVAEELPGKFALWSSPGADEVLRRLVSGHEERLRRLQGTVGDIRAGLERLLPAEPPATLAPVELVANAARIRRTFARLTEEATTEILIMHLPPYAFATGRVNAEGMRALRRGVSCRALYQLADLRRSEAETFRREHETYMAAGLDARVLPELPTKMALFDREKALLTTRTPAFGDYPTTIAIRDPGCVTALVYSFEHCWNGALPYRTDDFPSAPLTGGPGAVLDEGGSRKW